MLKLKPQASVDFDTDSNVLIASSQQQRAASVSPNSGRAVTKFVDMCGLPLGNINKHPKKVVRSDTIFQSDSGPCENRQLKNETDHAEAMVTGMKIELNFPNTTPVLSEYRLSSANQLVDDHRTSSDCLQVGELELKSPETSLGSSSQDLAQTIVENEPSDCTEMLCGIGKTSIFSPPLSPILYHPCASIPTDVAVPNSFQRLPDASPSSGGGGHVEESSKSFATTNAINCTETRLAISYYFNV